MTPTETNRAIAEIVKPESVARTIPITSDVSTNATAGTLTVTLRPNYHASLDACAGFEATLKTDAERDAYGEALWSVMFPKSSAARYYDFDGEIACDCATATAPQRCEAFLRLKGKWVG